MAVLDRAVVARMAVQLVGGAMAVHREAARLARLAKVLRLAKVGPATESADPRLLRPGSLLVNPHPNAAIGNFEFRPAAWQCGLCPFE